MLNKNQLAYLYLTQYTDKGGILLVIQRIGTSLGFPKEDLHNKYHIWDSISIFDI